MSAVAHPPIQLCVKLTTDLDAAICSHRCKGSLYRIAALICALALLVIFGGLTAIYMGLLASPPTWTLIVALVSALAATKGLSFWSTANSEFREAATFREITQKIEAISADPTFTVEGYFRDNNLPLETLTNNPDLMQALAEASPDRANPLKALYPLIARELVYKDDAVVLKRSETTHLGGMVDIAPAEGEEGPAVRQMTGFNRQSDSPEFEQMYHDKGLEARERLAYTRTEQAILLQNILKPDCLIGFHPNSDGRSINLWEEGRPGDGLVGHCTIKKGPSRAIEYSSEALSGIPRPRTFFAPADNARESLTTDRISVLSAAEIRRIVFD